MAAVSLLLVLLFVNIIQVAHTHTYKQQGPPTASIKHTNNTGNKEYQTAKAEAKCFICEYQLAKDADNVYAFFTVNSPVSFITITPATYSSVANDTYSYFETRGPPSMA